MDDFLEIAGKKISNRLFIGTGKFASYDLMRQVLEKTKCELCTVAVRRVNSGSKTENILDYIPKDCLIMANTSGARNAEEAVRIARLAQAAGCGNWIKVEIINDNQYLLPDNLESLKATEILAKEGFTPLVYMSPDISIGKRMVEAGAAAIMPLGSPIGTNRGLQTRELVEIMVNQLKISIVVDAGLGRPSDACQCMEIGCAAVLVNTAIAISPDPAAIAEAFSQAVKAGRQAYLAGMAEKSKSARASSSLTGFLR